VSLPLPQQFSRDLQLVGLAAERALQLGDLAAQLSLALALFLAGEALAGRRQQLVAPRSVSPPSVGGGIDLSSAVRAGGRPRK